MWLFWEEREQEKALQMGAGQRTQAVALKEERFSLFFSSTLLSPSNTEHY
jgi:hypothetical protein